MSKVLNAKNGVITEERFQKMTDVQWIFHYLETVAEEKAKSKYEIKMMETLLSVIKNNSDMIAAYTNPKLYTKVNEDFQKKKMFHSDDIGKEDENIASIPSAEEQAIMDGYNAFVSQFPEELLVEDNSRNKLVPKVTKEELLRRISVGLNKNKE